MTNPTACPEARVNLLEPANPLDRLLADAADVADEDVRRWLLALRDRGDEASGRPRPHAEGAN